MVVKKKSVFFKWTVLEKFLELGVGLTVSAKFCHSNSFHRTSKLAPPRKCFRTFLSKLSVDLCMIDGESNQRLLDLHVCFSDLLSPEETFLLKSHLEMPNVGGDIVT